MRKISSMLMLSMLLSCSNQGTLVTNNVVPKSNLSVDTTNKLVDNKVVVAQASTIPVKKVEQIINKVNDNKLVKDSSLVSKNILLPQVSSSPTPSTSPNVTVPTPIPTSTAIPNPTYTIDPDPYETHLLTSPMTENDQNLVPIKESDKGQGQQVILKPNTSYQGWSWTAVEPPAKIPCDMNEPLSGDWVSRSSDIYVKFKDEYKIRMKTNNNGQIILNADKLPIFISLAGENVDSVNKLVNKHKIDKLSGAQLFITEKQAADDKKENYPFCGCNCYNNLSYYSLVITDDDIRTLMTDFRENPLVRECNVIRSTAPD